MKKLLDWSKNNKFATVVIFVLLLASVMGRYSVYPISIRSGLGTDVMMRNYSGGQGGFIGASEAGIGKTTATNMMYPNFNPVAPTPNVKDRKVVTDATLSFQVKNVSETINNIKTKVGELGGYVVNVYLNRPEFGENATVSARIPAAKLDEFSTFAKGMAVKVVGENLNGSDITDQYVDLQTRLTELQKQKQILEDLLARAATVEDIMKVRDAVMQVQNEIDSVVGQIKYYDGASDTTLVTMYLSTDELSLPYSPELSWRPQVIFKNALRSLILNTQKLGTLAIWLAVYSVIIVPALTIVLIIYLLRRRRQSQNG